MPSTSIATAIPRASRASDVVRIETALRTVARLVMTDETYLPIFERLQREHAQAKAREDQLAEVARWAAE